VLTRSAGYACGCFVKVHVCEKCIGVADEYFAERVKDLTGQLQLPILDTMVSVSDSRTEDGDGIQK